MSGFRINGCGVTDHFKKIKSLGTHMCPYCNKMTEFTLDEVKQKIDIFFIPTMSLKSRYAVMCKSCKEGEFCTDEWAGYLLNQDNYQNIFESAAKKTYILPENQKDSLAVDNLKDERPEKITEPLQEKGKTAGRIPTFFKCTYCGITQMREGDFCAYCGKPAPELVNTNAEQGNDFIVCPSCGAKHKKENKFCSKCGRKLAAEEAAGNYW